MIQPLALLFYEKLLPGSQLVNKLQDLKYRVQTVHNAEILQECAAQAGPMLVLVDLESPQTNVCAVISNLKKNPATSHLPVIAFCKDNAPNLVQAAQEAGVTLCVNETAVLEHLPQLLDQALQVD